MAIEPRTLKGFRDYGLLEQSARQGLVHKIQSVFEQFGFLPLSTPALEYKEILMGKYGDDEKLVYSFEDNGGRQVAMRYDLTVPLARYIAENQGSLALPFKRYQIAPVWRAENPQKGRLREFYQCDVDVVGTESALSDIEVIACLGKALESLGLTNYKIRVNDRSVLSLLSADAVRVLDKVEKIGVDGMVAEMKERGITEAEIQASKNLASGVNVPIPERLQIILAGLKEYGLMGQIEFDPTIARGLDYYSGTVFETILIDKPEYGSICSGGRYDGLIDQYSSTGLAAVGGSIGIDRLYGALEELGLLPKQSVNTVIVLNIDKTLMPKYLSLARDLREAGLLVEMYYDEAKLEKQFKYAERKNIQWAVIMGSDEVTSGNVKVKNISTHDQSEVALSELSTYLKKS